MAKTKALSTRPPESHTAGATSVAEAARETLELANYAVCEAVTVVFTAAERAPGIELPAEGFSREIYYLPVWVDEDVLEFELKAWINLETADEAYVYLEEGLNLHQTTDIIGTGGGADSGSVVFEPAHPATSGQGQMQIFTVSVVKLLGTGPAYLREVRLRALVRTAASLPSPA